MNLFICWIATQIITESMPISSSGHLLLLQSYFKNYFSFDIEKYVVKHSLSLKALYYFLHGPTLLVISIYFFNEWYGLLRSSRLLSIMLWIAIADGITVVFYLFKSRIEHYFSLGAGLLITALALFSTYYCPQAKHSLNDWQLVYACCFGIIQSFAILPGISRLAITSVGGCLLGFSLYDSFIISWLLQLPLMAGAFIFSIQDLFVRNKKQQVLNWKLALIILFCSLISYFFLSLVMYTLRKKIFFAWGFYMIIPLMLWWQQRKREER